MKKILFFIIFITFFSLHINSAAFVTTAASVAWAGAYASIADGFEAMLYNPAGLYMTNRRFGLNVFGSYGFRFYNNTLSTDHVLKIFGSKESDLTQFIADRLNGMTDMGFDIGLDFSMMNFMFYIKYEKFSFGFSFLPKTYSKITIGKSLFQAIGQKLDLTNPLNLKISATFLQYVDMNFNLSARPAFLEKFIPVEAIFVGATGHFYLPTVLLSVVTSGDIKKGTPNSTGINTFDISLKGDVNVGGMVPHILSQSGLKTGFAALDDAISKSQSTGFGLGLDLGFIVKFNKIVKLGFSMTDIGFISIPQSTRLKMDLSKKIDFLDMANFTASFTDDIMNSLGNITNDTAFFYMMPLAIRCGIAVTPPPNKYFNLIVAADISVSDLNRAVNSEYPAFLFATGIEFAPKVMWFSLPLRL
ncbi:MAG TPA: DUF5723 family protein, partial [Spirochaetota bacterium]|nr:DUF5723 family protein [Spirochaetota bacterium]